jgi:miniconductance mechanosensitive channel
MLEFLHNWFLNQGTDADSANILARGILIALIIVFSVIANFVVKRIILRGIVAVISRSKTRWDDAILQRKVLNRISHLAPAIVIYLLTPLALQGYEGIASIISGAVLLYVIVVAVLIIDSLLNAGLDIYRTYEISKEIHIKGFIQIAKIVIYFLGGIFALSIILSRTPIYLLSGLGALTAVLMFIFKDAILGFVAGIQLTANKMVSRGDWIEMPEYNADGDVIDVSLTTVKVQNWDKTITTIPTYALISESFRNWRGMSESGGRRIKRSVFIDINTIKFCTDEMLERFAKIQFISEYIERKTRELAEYNKAIQVDDSSRVNRRRLTNVGTFRAYVVAYLRNHPKINQDMTFLIRQLSPTEHGLPIEIYVFTNDIVWANYEAIQADIFDHILAVVPEFDLKVFQTPAGSDIREFARQQRA